MKIAFRADASIQIGTGHVMRCLTLAEELKRQGYECLFICRDHKGHLGELITAKGFALYLLTGEGIFESTAPGWNAHASWLGVSRQQDAEQTRKILSQQPVDWLVVDHYALDAHWEQLVAEHTQYVMVIDDLADRAHQCDLLLDQTFGRLAEDYLERVSAGCELLCGSQYALLRPEFSELRPYSLRRREKTRLNRLLITMGGVDKDNATGQVLDILMESPLPEDCKITVVLGAAAPWLDKIRQQAQTMPWPVEIKVGVNNMAQLMADSDLAIGAAGATSWERCCLGLPTAMMVLADNQQYAANLLGLAGAVRVLQPDKNMKNEVLSFIGEAIESEIFLHELSYRSRMITDGKGCQHTINRLLSR